MPQQGQTTTTATATQRLTACCNMRQSTCCAFCLQDMCMPEEDGNWRMSWPTCQRKAPGRPCCYPSQTFRHKIHLECRGCRVRWFGFCRHLHTFVAERTKDVAPCMQIQFGWLVNNFQGSGSSVLRIGIWEPGCGMWASRVTASYLEPRAIPFLLNNKTLAWWCVLAVAFS